MPSGNYLASSYKDFLESISPYLDKEVKKRGAEVLAWDASYKELCKHKGQQVYFALITDTNELGEVRVQFHVVTDGHDQMEAAIKAFLATMRAYGQTLLRLFFTDKPQEDKSFFNGAILSLQAEQDCLDSLVPATEGVLEPCKLKPDQAQFCSTTAAINLKVNSLRFLIKGLTSRGRGVVALDCDITSFGRIAVIQLAYVTSFGEVAAVVMKVGATLPSSLHDLLADRDITFVDRGIAGDLAKIGRDFKCSSSALVSAKARAVELASMAARCGLVARASVSLDALTALVLKQHLSKEPTLRCSNGDGTLTAAQIEYAALDAVKSLEVWMHLDKLPDLILRLRTEDAIDGLEVDIMPAHGSMSMQASRGARAVIARPTHRLVGVLEVNAPALVVPRVKGPDGNPATIGSFGAPPYHLLLPLTMLAAAHAVTAPTSAAPPSTTTAAAAPTSALSATTPLPPPPTASNAPASAGGGDGDDGDDGDGGGGGNGEDLTEQEIAEMLHTAATAAGHGGSGEGVKLSAAPTGTIADKFSFVLGDAYHYMNRAKVPMHHSSKKGYYRVKASLRASGMADEEIEAKLYHDVSYFRARVPRVVPPPSTLYWRVRAVYAVYGPKCDENGKPLFNDAAWGKADNVLREIFAGLASDPPGFLFYKQPLADSHGNALYDCSRGSNHPEAHHKGLVTTFGTWNRLRPGFPVLGIYDTWLIDLLQVLVSQNRYVLLFPEWSNTGDLAPTAETFDMVPLPSTELGAAIDHITLTPEHAFIAKSMGIKLPLLLVHGKEENVLFHSLVLAAPPGPLNFDSMAIERCKHADGKAIFPKLPALNCHTTPASLPAPAPAPAASPPTRTIPAFIHPTPVLTNAILPTSALLTSALLPTTVLANPILPISTFPTSAFPTPPSPPPPSSLPPFGAQPVYHAQMPSAPFGMRAVSCAQHVARYWIHDSTCVPLLVIERYWHDDGESRRRMTIVHFLLLAADLGRSSKFVGDLDVYKLSRMSEGFNGGGYDYTWSVIESMHKKSSLAVCAERQFPHIRGATELAKLEGAHVPAAGLLVQEFVERASLIHPSKSVAGTCLALKLVFVACCAAALAKNRDPVSLAT
ncbi:hypothetical protein T492DRAFT_878692 [Pavlovales sp. CCMP2436]|nr:hypothetical protein T492DRAFT_878692 [Pavlovales sp. CCMP2436]